MHAARQAHYISCSIHCLSLIGLVQTISSFLSLPMIPREVSSRAWMAPQSCPSWAHWYTHISQWLLQDRPALWGKGMQNLLGTSGQGSSLGCEQCSWEGGNPHSKQLRGVYTGPVQRIWAGHLLSFILFFLLSHSTYGPYILCLLIMLHVSIVGLFPLVYHFHGVKDLCFALWCIPSFYNGARDIVGTA